MGARSAANYIDPLVHHRRVQDDISPDHSLQVKR